MSGTGPVLREQSPPPRGPRLVRGVGSLLRRFARPVLQPVAALGTPLAQVIARGTGPARPVVALQQGGVDVPLEEAFARITPTGRLALLLTGSGESDAVWSEGADPGSPTYGDRLGSVLGWSVLGVRYDAGGPLGEAALELHRLVRELVARWPLPLDRIVLLAHGDAGLLARSALGVRSLDPEPWTHRVTELVTLGTPALGTSVEAVSGGLGRRLDESLAGIVVLQPGALDVTAPAHVDHLVVTDRRVGRSHPLGRRLGDLLWLRHRALPSGRDVVDLFPTGERFQVDTRRHPLANHPQLHDALLRWLV